MLNAISAKLPLWLLTTARRRIWEMVGSRRYSRPAYQDIEDKLLRYFETPGFYVEAGGLDGFFESNTYQLERFYGWRGVLVEPVPRMFRRIAINRPRAMAFNCALVSSANAGKPVLVEDRHATSRVAVDEGANVVSVPGRTLSDVLDEVGAPRIDLLSLDVEGYEVECLKGLDFGRHAPRYMLIECLTETQKVELDTFLDCRYVAIDQFSERDFFYRRVESRQ